MSPASLLNTGLSMLSLDLPPLPSTILASILISWETPLLHMTSASACHLLVERRVLHHTKKLSSIHLTIGAIHPQQHQSRFKFLTGLPHHVVKWCRQDQILEHFTLSHGYCWTPTGVLLQSRRSPPGVHQELTRSPSGVHQELTRTPSRVHSESTRSPSGVHQELTRTPSRVRSESTRSPSRVHQKSIQSPPGVHPESIRSPPGVHPESTRSPSGVQLVFIWTPSTLQ